MITVRFPSGFSVQYNDLHHIKWQADGSALLMKSMESGWSVAVPKDCLIEFMHPCAAYNAAGPNDAVVNQIAQLERKIASLTKSVNKLRKGTLI